MLPKIWLVAGAVYILIKFFIGRYRGVDEAIIDLISLVIAWFITGFIFSKLSPKKKTAK